MNIIFKSLFAIALTVYGGSVLAADLPTSKNPAADSLYTSRVLGERALRHKLFDRAEKFFRRYKEEAEKKNDKSALKDASECLVSTLIRQAKPVAAQTELDALKKHFPDSDRLRRALYQAEIYLLKKHPDKAEEVLKSVLSPRKPVIGQLYFQMLSCQGYAQASQKKWKLAAGTFGLLRNASIGTPWEKKAYLQELNNAIRGRDYKLAGKLLAEDGKYRKDPEYQDIQKLRLMLLLEQKMLSEFKKAYTAAPFPETADSELYKLALAAANSFAAAEKYKDAVYFVRRAVKYAPDASSRRYALLRLVELYAADGSKKESAKAALDFAKFYPNAGNASAMRLKAADLLAGSGDYDEAIKICSNLIADKKVKPEQQAAAAIAAAEFAVAQKKWDLAENFCLSVDASKCSPAITGQGLFYIGEMRLKRKMFSPAAKAFLALANKNKDWDARARYEAARALEQAGEPAKVLNESRKLLLMDKLDTQLKPGLLYMQATALDKLDRDKESIAVYVKLAKAYPKHELADDALFKAGLLAFSAGNYEVAASCFDAFSTTYAKSEFAPNALYKGIYADIFRKKTDAAGNKLGVLRKSYPKSEYTAAAMFRQADEYFAEGRFKLTLVTLDHMEEMFKDNKKLMPRILAAGMAAQAELGNTIDALKLLDRAQSKYPGYTGLSEMYFLAGDLASRAGDYGKARKYFEAVPALRPGSALAAAASGRAGDSLYALYNKSFKEEQLNAAAGHYRDILSNKKISMLTRIQAAYKLGRCFEAMDQLDEALDKYSDAIFSGVPDSGKVSEAEKIWMVKAAYAAARIYARRGSPENAARAIRVYQILRKLKLKTGEDFDLLIDELKQKYRLN